MACAMGTKPETRPAAAVLKVGFEWATNTKRDASFDVFGPHEPSDRLATGTNSSGYPDRSDIKVWRMT